MRNCGPPGTHKAQILASGTAMRAALEAVARGGRAHIGGYAGLFDDLLKKGVGDVEPRQDGSRQVVSGKALLEHMRHVDQCVRIKLIRFLLEEAHLSQRPVATDREIEDLIPQTGVR